MDEEKLYIKPTEEEYEEVKDLNNTNKKILTYSILAIIIILVTIMHFETIVNIISSTINFIFNTLKYIFIENINIVKQLSFVTFILLTNALLLIHVKTLKHVTFKRHRPNYLKKYSNTKFWDRVYSVISLPLLYLVYGTFTQFLILILIVGIPVSIYTYYSINNIEKLYPEIQETTLKKELMLNIILLDLKKSLKKEFVVPTGFEEDYKYKKELNIIINFLKFVYDSNQTKNHQKKLDLINSYFNLTTYNTSTFEIYRYDEITIKLKIDEIENILKKHNIPILDYINHSYYFGVDYDINGKVFKMKLKNNIFY